MKKTAAIFETAILLTALALISAVLTGVTLA